MQSQNFNVIATHAVNGDVVLVQDQLARAGDAAPEIEHTFLNLRGAIKTPPELLGWRSAPPLMLGVKPHNHQPTIPMPKPLFVILAIAAGAAGAAGPYTPEQIRAAIRQAGSPERFLAAIATNTAKMSGQMFDDQTQLTGAAANQKTLAYYLRLVNYDKADIPDLSAFRRKVASTLSPSVCTAPVASILINEHGAEYTYMAYSKSREYLFEYSFNRTTCALGCRW